MLSEFRHHFLSFIFRFDKELKIIMLDFFFGIRLINRNNKNFFFNHYIKDLNIKKISSNQI